MPAVPSFPLAFWFHGPRPPPPDAVQVQLALPLLQRTASLVLAHFALLLLCGIAVARIDAAWPWLFLVANLAAVTARLVVLRRLRASHEAGLPRGILAATRDYCLVGGLWAGLGGGFSYLGITQEGDEPLRLLVTVVALATASGAGSRNAATPRFALLQVVAWLLPLALGAAEVGCWSIAGLVLLYIIALASLIQRHFGDLLALASVARAKDALAGRLAVTLGNMKQGLALYDAEGRLQLVNRRFHDAFALPPDSLSPGMTEAEVAARCEVQAEDWVGAGASGPGWAEGLLTTRAGRAVAVSRQALADGGWVVTCEDVTERRRDEARITHMARHDSLTGLPNRAMFRERMEAAVARLGRGEPFVLLCLDLDGFKAVNDTRGHATGDRLLCMVAERIQACLREIDTVARLGGDEFAILLPRAQCHADVELIATRLIGTVGAPYPIDGRQAVIGVSIGAAFAPADGSLPDRLMRQADLALYRAKESGRGRFCRFEPEMEQRLQARRSLEAELRGALDRGEFELHYQPIVAVETTRVVRLEALLRWRHPVRGLLAPEGFIAALEDAGLSGTVSEWVLRRACADAMLWPDGLGVAVHCALARFRGDALAGSIAAALRETGLAPARLELEVTEAVIGGGDAGVAAALGRIRGLGVRVALDDFGTGTFSLGTLHTLPLDRVKIDRSFVGSLGTSNVAESIMQAIVTLARSLDFGTTAEGVDTAEQLRHVRRIGCDEAQGHVFSAPCPGADVPAMLRGIAARLEDVAPERG
ncbi:EAL domain-containing protein [Rhodovastum atsumiense]|uniref:EAL domain-containing protein n=1 Tax=Rhodovastum atsumiense TaxID=504468 RepID=A0A5M6IQ50_9PROT|nr:EAL domain-containing protein [Rhodovastum atsumiense]KAA5610403.1 EAL domain-containing protein [Rhodovastum atsumiense]CAH2602912.1 EAL domain-containing protein [Rhodovastum atsumiense]